MGMGVRMGRELLLCESMKSRTQRKETDMRKDMRLM
jgi:hypothetical protein